ncbi:MAG TPA: hypothetical protein VEL79_20790 [Vicinamibacterales bacterium]|nr:hypothetical protein [Vicinamibacterales bacterium]
MSDAEYFAIKDRAANRLLAIPHVNLVGIGGRERNGQPTGEVVIKVFVTRKRPAAELPPDEVIPSEIEGVPTDVVEMGPAKPLATVPGAANPIATTLDGTHVDPLQGGMEIAIEAGFKGTLGCILRDRDDGSAVYGLTNHHVVAVDGNISFSRRVLQPSAPPDTTFDPIGIVSAGGDDRYRDAAAIRLQVDLKWLPAIREIGFVRGTHDITVAEAKTQTYPVRKRGARTKLTGGVVIAINADGSIGHTSRKNATVIRPNSDPANPTAEVAFAWEGDSGSVVVNDDNEIVALVYSSDRPGGVSLFMNAIATPIGVVLDRFKRDDKVDLVVAAATSFETATDANQLQTVPPVAGAPILPISEGLAHGEHAHFRPLPAGSQILAAPMLGAPNAGTLGCLLEDPADSGAAYALTAFGTLDANGTIPPTADTDVGQPDNDHSISGCCSNTIGQFFRGGPDQGVPAAAMVKLANDQKWLAEILRIGTVIGVGVLDATSLSENVRKHGAHSRLTGGTIVAIGGVAGTLPPGVRPDAIVVRPNPNPFHPDQDLCFGRFTDRGAVIVDHFNSVLGVLYDEVDIPDNGRHLIHGVATPIRSVLDALKVASGVAVAVATAATPDQVRTTSSMQAVPSDAVHPARRRVPVRVVSPAADAGSNATDLQRALAGSRGGRWILASWLAHRDEIRRLIVENRRVAARWRLGGGPALLQALIRSMYADSATIPASIDGQPIAACISRIAGVFLPYGSAALRVDVARLRAVLPPIDGLSYSELVSAVADAVAAANLPDPSEA